MDNAKSPLDLLYESLHLRAGKRADLAVMMERRRSMLAELQQLDDKILTMEQLIAVDDAAAKRYARECFDK